MLKKLVQTDDDAAMLIVRLVLGIVIFPHGAQKLVGWFGGGGFAGTMQFFTSQLGLPAAVAFQFTRRQGALAVLSWIAGVLASAAGLWLSFRYDLPTGPLIVCAFGVVLLLAYGIRRALGERADAALEPVGAEQG